MMKQAFVKPEEPVAHSKMKLTPRRLVILLVIVFTAIITAAAIVVWYGNFYGQKHLDNTEFFALSDDAPEVIEKVYELSELPEGFELVQESGGIGDKHVYRLYMKGDYAIFLEQYTIKYFRYQNDEDENKGREIQINGQSALLFDYNNMVIIYLNNNNYIVAIRTNLERDDAVNMLKMLK